MTLRGLIAVTDIWEKEIFFLSMGLKFKCKGASDLHIYLLY